MCRLGINSYLQWRLPPDSLGFSCQDHLHWGVALEDKHNLEGRKVSCTGSMTRESVNLVYDKWGPEGRVRPKEVKRPTPCTGTDMKEMNKV